MTRFTPSRPWDSSSNDPNDETFGDVVERIDVQNTDDGFDRRSEERRVGKEC